ncbi:SGNH/GDSL hydrolase family protein [Streptomyces sp. NPDC057302]|uniref:SGNH/GDSL hydrolase family protein n=1 Tax=Streptomyces sp. NPDC057302 TaxID=3346094 RepID=UPI00363915AF
MRTPLRALLVTSLLCGTAAAAPTATAAEKDRLQYVALGDSFAAAPLVRPADPADPKCVRSLADYPHIAAGALGADLTDVSCSGATADDFTASQHPGTAPQYDALSAGTDLVSITIGANDNALSSLPSDCLNLLPKPLGKSCAATYTQGGTDRYGTAIDAWAPKFDVVLDTVRQRAPNAEVFVVGYGKYFRTGGCFPVQPYWGQDADYIQAKINQLGRVLRTTAARHGATFVDTDDLGTDHDSCAPAADRYIEGAVSTSDAFPLHPNARGSRANGRALADAVRADVSPR